MTTPVPYHIFKSLSSDAANSPLTVQNCLDSPLLRLPGEIRNLIYIYAFAEQCITVFTVWKSHSPRLHLHVEPFGYPKPPSQRYPLHHLFARRTVCRQIHAETAGFILRLNTFGFQFVQTISSFVRGIPRDYVNRVEKIRLDFQPAAVTAGLIKEMGKYGLDWMKGLKRCVVVTRNRGEEQEEADRALWGNLGLIGRGCEVVFEEGEAWKLDPESDSD